MLPFDSFAIAVRFDFSLRAPFWTHYCPQKPAIAARPHQGLPFQASGLPPPAVTTGRPPTQSVLVQGTPQPWHTKNKAAEEITDAGLHCTTRVVACHGTSGDEPAAAQLSPGGPAQHCAGGGGGLRAAILRHFAIFRKFPQLSAVVHILFRKCSLPVHLACVLVPCVSPAEQRCCSLTAIPPPLSFHCGGQASAR